MPNSSVAILVPSHASVEVPTDLRPRLLLSDHDLAAELVRMTDTFTDDLSCIARHRAVPTADSTYEQAYPVKR